MKTLCWKCAKACDGSQCPWVRDNTPVKGWDADKTIIKCGAGDLYAYEIDSYLIKKCPLFAPDGKKHKPQRGGIKPLPEGYLTTHGLGVRWGMNETAVRLLTEEGLPFVQDKYRRRFCIIDCERWWRTSG